MTTQLWSILLVIVADFIGSFGSVMLKMGSGTITRDFRSIYRNYRRTLFLIGGLALYGFSAVLFTTSLKGGELSVLYPFVSIGYVFIVFLSKLILKERINSWKVMGISSIILGVVLIGFGS
jgi:multidrug transporter EmrE-like cation transporter